MQSAAADMLNKPREAQFGGGEGGFLFAKGEADLGRAIADVIVEAGAGNDGDPDFFDKKLGESDVIGITETGDVRHDVVRAAGLENGEVGLLQDFQEAFA